MTGCMHAFLYKFSCHDNTIIGYTSLLTNTRLSEHPQKSNMLKHDLNSHKFFMHDCGIYIILLLLACMHNNFGDNNIK